MDARAGWLIGMTVCAATSSLAAPLTALQRLEPANLQRARRDVAAIRRHRSRVWLVPKLRDYRCVIHAHSDLSHDSRGTIAEIAAAARAARVAAVFLTNHPRKDRDVAAAGPQDVVGGVLFVSGAETNGFLLFPRDNRLPPLDLQAQELVDRVTGDGGLAFIAHPEEHADWGLTGLTGMEISNIHADLMADRALLAALQPRTPQGWDRLLLLLRAMARYPQEAYGALWRDPSANLAHYDRLAAAGPFTAIAANDSHQNTGYVLRALGEGRVAVEDPLGERQATVEAGSVPALSTLAAGAAPGSVVLRAQLDPYPISFGYVSTHVLAPARTRRDLWEALQAGRTYVAYDWMADPTGAAFVMRAGRDTWPIGAAVALRTGLRLVAAVPVSAAFRVLRDGREVARAAGSVLSYPVAEAGVYRIEADLTVAGEQRPWIYTGAFRVGR